MTTLYEDNHSGVEQSYERKVGLWIVVIIFIHVVPIVVFISTMMMILYGNWNYLRFIELRILCLHILDDNPHSVHSHRFHCLQESDC